MSRRLLKASCPPLKSCWGIADVRANIRGQAGATPRCLYFAGQQIFSGTHQWRCGAIVNKQRFFRSFLILICRSHVTLVSPARDRYSQLQEALPSVGVPQLHICSHFWGIFSGIFLHFRTIFWTLSTFEPYPTVRASCWRRFHPWAFPNC